MWVMSFVQIQVMVWMSSLLIQGRCKFRLSVLNFRGRKHRPKACLTLQYYNEKYWLCRTSKWLACCCVHFWPQRPRWISCSCSALNKLQSNWKQCLSICVLRTLRQTGLSDWRLATNISQVKIKHDHDLQWQAEAYSCPEDVARPLTLADFLLLSKSKIAQWREYWTEFLHFVFSSVQSLKNYLQ